MANIIYICTYSTAFLYTSMALSVSPASRWTFPSIMKVLSCLFILRAIFRCSSAWERQKIKMIKSLWNNYNLSCYSVGKLSCTHIFEVFDEEIAQSQIMTDLLGWENVRFYMDHFCIARVELNLISKCKSFIGQQFCSSIREGSGSD